MILRIDGAFPMFFVINNKTAQNPKNEMKKEMKNYKIILTQKQQKYQHYHLKTLIDINILQVKKYYVLIREQ